MGDSVVPYAFEQEMRNWAWVPEGVLGLMASVAVPEVGIARVPGAPKFPAVTTQPVAPLEDHEMFTDPPGATVDGLTFRVGVPGGLPGGGALCVLQHRPDWHVPLPPVEPLGHEPGPV